MIPGSFSADHCIFRASTSKNYHRIALHRINQDPGICNRDRGYEVALLHFRFISPFGGGSLTIRKLPAASSKDREHRRLSNSSTRALPYRVQSRGETISVGNSVALRFLGSIVFGPLRGTDRSVEQKMQ